MAGTKRTPIGRDLKTRVSAEAVALFQRAMPLKRFHDRCLRDAGRCSVGTHCPECLEYSRLGKALAAELGIGWVVGYSPLDVAAKMPDYIRNNPAQEPDYRRAQELRQVLLEAVGAEADHEAGTA